MSLGAINHVALTVSDLELANSWLSPVFNFLGYTKSEAFDGLSIWVSGMTGIAINLWQADPELSQRRHERYASGLHHIAFDAASRNEVDELHRVLLKNQIPVLDVPADYDYAPVYYAVYFEGPDGMKWEFVFHQDEPLA